MNLNRKPSALSVHKTMLTYTCILCIIHIINGTYPYLCQQHTTLHLTVDLPLKLSRIGPGQSLDGRPDAAGSCVGGPVGGTLSSGLKNIY